ncbi:MAG: DegV family protein [Oscillospiraceae bacterium]|nr:DegV family protein [Oscillospiraceae bacterium]
MNKYRLITDSGADITKEMAQQHEIDLIPFSILIDDKEYWETIDLTTQQFYELAVKSPTIPKTNQITTGRFEEKIIKCLDDGVQDIIIVTINSAGSGTYQAALNAKANLSDRLDGVNLHIIDSHTYSIGYGYPVVEAAKKLKAGKSVKSVIDYLEDWFAQVQVCLVGFDLRHMKKSGRITAAASFMGELMGIRPIIRMKNDKTMVVQKVRGDKAVIEAAVEYVAQTLVPETPWTLLRTTVTEYEEAFVKGLTKKIGYPPAFEGYSGCAVSSNAGTKMFAILYKTNLE